jgi:hypothetical protein
MGYGLRRRMQSAILSAGLEKVKTASILSLFQPARSFLEPWTLEQQRKREFRGKFRRRIHSTNKKC